MSQLVLYVDDDAGNIEAFKLAFEEQFTLRTATGGAEALAIMEREDIAVLLADERMPGMSGVELLARAAERHPLSVRVIVSAYSDTDRLLRAINHGHPYYYIVKPWNRAQLVDVIQRSLQLAERLLVQSAQADLGELHVRDLVEKYDTARIIGEHGGLTQVIADARLAARSDTTVLVLGETGTGKELIARLIHDASPRARLPFVSVNCAALAEGVLESELFGHEKGAFTSAFRQQKGRFEVAHRGTIFLDEIGEVPAKVQATLLRVLQEKTIERVGSSTSIRVDVRVIAATHRDLRRLVKDGKFREDLYYRLDVVQLQIPPLRERREDIRPLVAHFLDKHGPKSARTAVAGEAYPALEAYRWPGNVRELENGVQRALALARAEVLTLDNFRLDLDEVDDPMPSSPPAGRSLDSELEQQRWVAVLDALERCGGNQTEAAKRIGMSRRTLVALLRRYGFKRKRDPK